MSRYTLDGYKLYTFVNCTYMREVQFGIQTTHALGEAVKKYVFQDNGEVERQHVANYINHEEPFVIILDGSYLERMEELKSTLDLCAEVLELPRVDFYESRAAMGGMMTVIGYIIPDNLINPEFLYLTENGYLAPDAHIVPPVDSPDERIAQLRYMMERAGRSGVATQEDSRRLARILMSEIIEAGRRAR